MQLSSNRIMENGQEERSKLLMWRKIHMEADGITVRRWPQDCAKEELSDNRSLLLLSGTLSHLLSESRRHRNK